MGSRFKKIATINPDVLAAVQALMKAAEAGGVPASTRYLAHMRASQINGCGMCLDFSRQQAKQLGESEERIFCLAGWRHTSYFTGAERAALALTEALTRLADREDPVPDAVWEEAARYYDEAGLAALVLTISVSNLFNRLNVATGQTAGSSPVPTPQ